MFDKFEENYEFNYWFNDIISHGNVNDYGEKYYAYKIFDQIITKLPDVPRGYIVVLGTHRCVSFDLLCRHFGYHRCWGIDLHNPTNHPKVQIKNAMELTDTDSVPIAFVHNDIGNFTETPQAKLHAQQWAAKNVVTGGYFLGRTNANSLNYDLEGMMQSLGFENTRLSLLSEQYNTQGIEDYNLEYHMLSKKL